MRRMDTTWVQFHLREAAEEIARLIKSCDGSIGEIDLSVGMEHAYHHLNTAWNERWERIGFEKARRFPPHMKLSEQLQE